MIVVPIAAREARVVARRARSYHLRWVFGLLGFGAILFGMWIGRYGNPTQGEIVFNSLGIAAHLYCLFAGVIAAADAISSERREQTLGLLFLTDLKPTDVLLGKVISSCATTFFGLLALIPLLGLPFLMGGVSLERFGWLALSLFNTLFLSIAVGFLASSIFRQGWATLLAGLIFMFTVGIALPLIHFWFNTGDGFTFISPGFSLHPALESILDDNETRQAYQSFLFTHGLAWGCLWIVTARLVYLWRDRPRNALQEKRFQLAQKLRFGTRAARKKLRTELLDQNPLAWLANREQISSFGLLAFWSAFFLIFMLLLMLTADYRFESILAFGFTGLAIAHLTLFFRISVAAAFQMAEERRSGALELLLSTPLSVAEIIRGRWLALIRQFSGPILVLSVMHLFFLIGFGTQVEQGVLPQLARSAVEMTLGEQQLFFAVVSLAWIIFALNWFAGGWFGLWFGLRARTSAGAVWATVFFVLILPWLCFLGLIIATSMLGVFEDFNSTLDINAESIFFWIATFLALISAGTCIFLGRRKAMAQFRLAAAGALGALRPNIPWRLVFRLSLGAAALLILIAIPARAWRERVNARGARLWREALAAHPTFSMEKPLPPTAPPIPVGENLAETEAFAALFYRTSVRGFNPMVSPYVADHQLEPWTRGELFKLDAIEEMALKQAAAVGSKPGLKKGLLLTNRLDTPAHSVLRLLSREEPLFQDLFAEFNSHPRIRLKKPQGNAASITRTLAIHAIARLRSGEPTTDEIRFILSFYDGLRYTKGDPSPLLYDSFQPTFEGLAQHRWSEAQLQQLQEAFERVDIWLIPAISVDETVRDAMPAVASYPMNQADSLLNRFLAYARPQGWRDETKAQFLQVAYELLPPIFDAKSHRISLPNLVAFQASPQNTLAEKFVHQYGNGLSAQLAQKAFLQASLNQAIIACALERYRLRNGHHPAGLNELVPGYLSKVPLDPVTETPMIYCPLKEGYRLYSVAWDGHDNGGTLRKVTCSECKYDWVWSFAR